MKTALKVIGIIVLLLIVVAIAAPFLINVNHFRPEIESRVSEAMGRPVKIGDLSLSILSGGVEANQLSIADDPKFSTNPFITAKSLKVGVELMPLIFNKQLNVTNIDIVQPSIMLLRNQAGVWNFSSLGSGAKKTPSKQSSSGSQNLTIAKLDLTDGKVTMGTLPAKRKPIQYDKVNITVRNFAFDKSFPVTLSMALPNGGTAKADGTMGPINAADASLTPLKAKLNIGKLDLSQSALVDPTLGVSGTADFDGSLNSDGRTAKTSGTVKATNLKLVPKGSPAGRPLQIQYSLEHDLARQSGRLLQGDVTMGKALAKLVGTYDMNGDTTSIRMKLNGQNMPVDELVAMLPALGVVLPSGSQLKGGTLTTDLDAAGPLDKLLTTGSVRLSNSELAGFNLGSKLSAISALSGKQTGNDTSVQNASTDVRMAPDGTQLNNINLVIPAIGTVIGTGTVSPSGALDFKMAATLNGGAVTGLTQIAGLGNKGTGSLPFLIRGTTSNPSFVPDVQGLVRGQLKNLIPSGQDQNGANPLGGLMDLFGKKKKPH